MQKEAAKEAVIAAARGYFPALAQHLQFDFALEEKELTVELGGCYTSDFEELATGQWDVYTQPYTKNYRFIGYNPIFNDKAIVRNREYTYRTINDDVRFVLEKIVFAIPSVPTDANFSFELEHRILENNYLVPRRGKDYYFISILCKGIFKARDTVLCEFEIRAEDDEHRNAVETIYPLKK